MIEGSCFRRYGRCIESNAGMAEGACGVLTLAFKAGVTWLFNAFKLVHRAVGGDVNCRHNLLLLSIGPMGNRLQRIGGNGEEHEGMSGDRDASPNLKKQVAGSFS